MLITTNTSHMKKLIFQLLPATTCICLFLISCEAQTDSLRVADDWIEQLRNDPLLAELQEAHLLRQDLIISDRVDTRAAGNFLKSSESQDPCALGEEVLNVKGGKEYFGYLCRYSSARKTINERYPGLASLDPIERRALLYPSRSLTREDVLEMRMQTPD